MTRFNDYYQNYIDGAWVDGGVREGVSGDMSDVRG